MPANKTNKKNKSYIVLNDKNSLKLGSLVFFYDLNAKKSSVEHVAICVGTDDMGVPQLAHAVDGKYTSGVVTTPMLAQYGYIIATPLDKKIRDVMTEIARQYSQDNESPHKIPYDRRRAKKFADRRRSRKLQTPREILADSTEQQRRHRTREVVTVAKWIARASQPIRPADKERGIEESDKGFRCAHLCAILLQMAILRRSTCQINTLKHLAQQGIKARGISMAGDTGILTKRVSEDFTNKWTNCLSPKTRNKTPYPGMVPAILALGTSLRVITTNFDIASEALQSAPWVAKLMTPGAFLEWISPSTGGGGGELGWNLACIDNIHGKPILLPQIPHTTQRFDPKDLMPVPIPREPCSEVKLYTKKIKAVLFGNKNKSGQRQRPKRPRQGDDYIDQRKLPCSRA